MGDDSHFVIKDAGWDREGAYIRLPQVVSGSFADEPSEGDSLTLMHDREEDTWVAFMPHQCDTWDLVEGVSADNAMETLGAMVDVFNTAIAAIADMQAKYDHEHLAESQDG